MASAARSRPRAAAARPRRAPRPTLPQPSALRPSPTRRPGDAPRPAPEPAPARVRRRPASARRGRRLARRGREIGSATLLDRLLRGRLWVVLIAVLLVGIVFLNVALLELNGSIARMDARAGELARENGALRMRVARLGSSERIQRTAAQRGFVAVEPGRVSYLEAGPGDAAAAARALEDWPARALEDWPSGGRTGDASP